MFKNFFRKMLGSSGGPPVSFPIALDDYHAKHIGTLSDGMQYFITSGFGWEERGGVPIRREFICLYIFKPDGSLLEVDIREFDASEPEWIRHLGELQSRLEQRGALTPGDIVVRPFSVKRFGVEFGLIPQEPDDPGEPWPVILEPGNFMAFFDPWDGTYDT